MYVLGISFGYHDSAAAICTDGKLLACAQEERFTRIKHDPSFPIQAINFCCQSANISPQQIDSIAFYEKPYTKFHRALTSHALSFPFSFQHFLRSIPSYLGDRLNLPTLLKTELGIERELFFIPHHLAHAASAFYCSPFESAALLISDGVGEWSTLSCANGNRNNIHITKELTYPNSLGLLYTAVTAHLGFTPNGGEGKLMGLADYGTPNLYEALLQTVDLKDDGSFRINPTYWDFLSGNRMVTRKFMSLFGPPRKPQEPILEIHKNLAASIQKLTEVILLRIATQLYNETQQEALCLAGGSFLNIPTNTRILRETPFKKLFIQPAASDAGAALGAALFVSHSIKKLPRLWSMNHAYWGPSFDDRAIVKSLRTHELPVNRFTEEDLLNKASQLIADNKIVGWFQDKMEFGPRALGHRSILASTTQPDIKSTLNQKVKHREAFRPYGVSILESAVEEYFQFDAIERDKTDYSGPFMLKLGKIRETKKQTVPGAIHVNGTSRIQTVNEGDGLYFKLLVTYQNKTGLPLFINTSFNDNHEPIVLTPDDACRCFKSTQLDALIMGNYVVEKNN